MAALHSPLDPFADVANPALYVPRPASDRALREVLEGVLRAERPVAVLAPPGLGKTLLLRLVAAKLPSAFRVVYVPNPGLTPTELCAWTLGCLRSPPWSDPIAVVAAYAEHRASTGGALVWLMDDAHGLPDETARWLGHMVARPGGALRLVLAALPEDGKALAPLGPLRHVDALAEPMERGETASYVFERLVRACAPAELLARCKTALDALHEAGAGVPREVSAACTAFLAEPAWRAALSRA